MSVSTPTAPAAEIIGAEGTTAAVLSTQFPFAAGYRVGDIVELSGQTGHRPDLSLPEDLGEQVAQAFRNIEATLASGGFGWSNVYALRTYHVVPAGAESIPGEAIGAVLGAFAEHLGDKRPAWTAIGVSALAFPGMHIEIEVKATV